MYWNGEVTSCSKILWNFAYEYVRYPPFGISQIPKHYVDDPHLSLQ
jgi:hypothetical protein